MIVFKKLRTKRIKPFERIGTEKKPPAQDDESQTEIERHNSKRKAENDELIAPIKRQKSDHTIFGSRLQESRFRLGINVAAYCCNKVISRLMSFFFSLLILM